MMLARLPNKARSRTLSQGFRGVNVEHPHHHYQNSKTATNKTTAEGTED